jgi:hypothetical protein
MAHQNPSRDMRCGTTGDVVRGHRADRDTGDTRRQESAIWRLEAWAICRGRVRARSRHLYLLRRDSSRRPQLAAGDKQFSEAGFEKA